MRTILLIRRQSFEKMIKIRNIQLTKIESENKLVAKLSKQVSPLRLRIYNL